MTEPDINYNNLTAHKMQFEESDGLELALTHVFLPGNWRCSALQW